VAIQHGQITAVPLNMISDKVHAVVEKHSPVLQARNMGRCFGDESCSRMN
jgi:hypothetical protein